MNKKVLSCLLAAVFILVFAFSASADVLPPQGDGFLFDETVADVLQDAEPQSEIFEQEIERIDISDELASYLAEETADPGTEDETVVLYGAAEAPVDQSLPDVGGEAAQGSVVKPILICLVIGAVIALIVVLAVKSGYKPVHRRRDAAEYLVDGSLHVTVSDEKFVRSERSERTIENKTGSD